MRAAAAVALGVLLVMGCSPAAPGGAASSTRTSTSPAPSPAPASTMATKLSCGDSPIGAKALAVYRYATSYPLVVGLLDVSNPLFPNLACTLIPAFGAHILSPTKLAFWNDNELGTADLGSGAIRETGRLSAAATAGAFNADGTKFAYRSYVDGGAMTTHLFVDGLDRALYVQQPVAGQGGPGPGYGPFDQLQFSPDGTLLLDYMLLRPPSGPPNLIVFRADGSIAFQTSGATGGVWGPTGHTLFFYAGDLNRLDANGQPQVVAGGLHGMNWPAMVPDGSGIIYTASGGCGGVPHQWRLDLGTGRSTQLSTAISADAVFVQRAVFWSDQQSDPCGPGGPTSPDHPIITHDLNTGVDGPVSTDHTVPASGHGVLGPTTALVIDTWFAQ